MLDARIIVLCSNYAIFDDNHQKHTPPPDVVNGNPYVFWEQKLRSRNVDWPKLTEPMRVRLGRPWRSEDGFYSAPINLRLLS